MSVINLVTRVGHKVLHKGSKHAPTILTAVGVVGSVTSTVLAAKATLKLPAQNKAFELNRIDVKARREHEVGYTDKQYKRDLTLVYAKHSVDLAKIYGPAIGLSAASIVCIITGHGIMVKREATLVGALAVVERGFAEYRRRVESDPDISDEKKLLYRHGEYEIEETTDEAGNKVQSYKFADNAGADIYARFFDEYNPNWKGSPTMNLTFLRGMQRYANELLTANGHVFLNEVYDMLGYERTGYGAVVGWKLTGGPTGENYVSFGFDDGSKLAVRQFINKQESSVLLDFNVDGVIWDKI